MQPHSMCAVALAGYMWNRPESLNVSKCNMAVEYRKSGDYKMNTYELSNIRESVDKREITALIMRGGGGIACTVTIRRSSAQEGSLVTMTHGQIPVAGLREVFNLYKKRISSGMHYNSERYRNFQGEYRDSGRRKLWLRSEVKSSYGQFYDVDYELDIRQVTLA